MAARGTKPLRRRPLRTGTAPYPVDLPLRTI